MHTKRIFSLLLAALMLLSLAPLPARAAESALAYTCTGVQNSGAILSVNKAVTATLDAPELATLTQTGNTVTVTAKSGAVGVITVHLSAADETADVQIPLGYTTFRFQEDRLTVIPGSDSNYEISGINAAGEEYLEGDPTYPLPVQTDENGNRVYTNTDTYKICVNIKKKGGTYAFDGSSEDMSIAVKKEATGAAVLLLGDLSLRSSFTAPITVKKNSTTTVTVTALAGHTAVLEDAALNNADLYGDPADGGNGTNATYAESAVIKAKTDAKLTLNGAGTLSWSATQRTPSRWGKTAV